MHTQPIPVPRCPRCHGEHPSRVARPFKAPIGEFPAWLTCPVTFEPILVRQLPPPRRSGAELTPTFELI